VIAGEQLEAETLVVLERQSLGGAAEDLLGGVCDQWTVGPPAHPFDEEMRQKRVMTVSASAIDE